MHNDKDTKDEVNTDNFAMAILDKLKSSNKKSLKSLTIIFIFSSSSTLVFPSSLLSFTRLVLLVSIVLTVSIVVVTLDNTVDSLGIISIFEC